MCEECDEHWCFECRLKECRQDWKNACEGCLRMIGPKLARCYDRMQVLDGSMQNLGDGMQELDDKMQELDDSMQELDDAFFS